MSDAKLFPNSRDSNYVMLYGKIYLKDSLGCVLIYRYHTSNVDEWSYLGRYFLLCMRRRILSKMGFILM